MAKAQILIVEDDGIIAMDLESRLKSLGYSVPAIVAYGEQAIQKVKAHRIDIVMMDIVLKGDMDGIEAAKQIRTQFEIPVVFVTAHMDEDRLERAKLTLPFGYILKPFQDRELKTTIEMALYTCKVDAERKQAEKRLLQESAMRGILLDNLPCVALILKKGTREIVGSNQAAKQIGAVPGKICYETCVQRDDICPFCLAPKLWATGDPQRLEVEYRGTYYECIWVPLTDELYVHYIFDITDSKKAEEALRESEEKFRSLFNNAEVGMFRTRIDGSEILDMNEKFLEIFCRTREEMKDSPSVIHWADPSQREEMVHRLELEGRVTNFECGMLNKNGVARTCLTSLRLYREQGILEGSIIDITERKRMEEAFHLSEDKYRMLVETMNDGLAVYDKNNLNTYTNEKFCQMLGYSIDEIIGRPAEDFLDEDNQSILKEQIVKRKKGGQEPYELVWTRKDGQKIYTIISPEPMFDSAGQYSGSFAIITDITEIKHSKKMLQESEAFTKAVLDNLPIGIAVNSVDPAVKFEYMNDNFLKFYRTTREKLAAPDAYWNAVYEEPEFREEIKKRVLDDCASGDPERMYWVDVPITRKGDETSFITARNIPIPDKKLMISTVWDVTERKQMEARLQQSQKMESIGTLAGGIAHDFNNILFSMMGFAEMALDDLQEDSPLRNNIKEILQGTKRARDLVKQILAFSRQSGKELKPLKVQSILKEVLKLARSSLPSTIEIKQYISNKCGLVMADATQIHQVAMNLITNAFQAMEDEGGKLEVTLKEVELGAEDLTDPSMTPGAYVCLTVADTGPGMDQSVISRVFEPYFTTKENGKGTGLGLAVVHGIVKSYEGDIRVHSEPGKGTAFHVYLPVLKSQVETEETETVTPVQKGTERILLVDDEEPIVSMETQMLERLGYHVTARTSSIEALEAFRAAPDKFDLVITDMTMPNMTGIELSQKLLEIRPDIPIIICTGFSTKIDGEKAKAVGIRGYVMKPVVMSEIAKKIREVQDQD